MAEMTTEKWQRLHELRRAGRTIGQICMELDISPNTAWRWLKTDTPPGMPGGRKMSGPLWDEVHRRLGEGYLPGAVAKQLGVHLSTVRRYARMLRPANEFPQVRYAAFGVPWHPEALALREAGVETREIADKLGVSLSLVYALFVDPTARRRARHVVAKAKPAPPSPPPPPAPRLRREPYRGRDGIVRWRPVD